MLSAVVPPLVIFVAMPGTDMGPYETWRNATSF